MKHTPYVCPILVTILSISVHAAAVRPEIGVPYFDSSQTAIAIDGDYSDWPAKALQSPINFYNGDGKKGTSKILGTTVLGTMSGREDGEVTVYLAHDGEFIYLLAIIQDDLLEQRTSENNRNEAWKEDCLHIYMDTNNSAKSNISGDPISTQPGYEQFGVSTDYNCYTENGDFVTPKSSGTAKAGAQPDQVNWLVGIQITGSGPYTYVFEERMPLNEVPGYNLRTMNPGESYGFNAEFCDSDAKAYLQGWIFWSGPGSTDVWNKQNQWGLMNLEPIPTGIPNWMLVN